MEHRFDDRITGRLDKFSPKARIIHIDVDPASISKNIKAHIPIVGDVKDAVNQISKKIIQKNLMTNNTINGGLKLTSGEKKILLATNKAKK